MRLLLLSDASSRHTQRWAEWFSARGHQVRLASLEDPEDLSVPFYRLPGRSRWWEYLAAAVPLKRIISEFQPDLINAHYVPSYGLLGRLTKFRPLVISAWGSDLLVSPKKSWWHRWRVEWALSGVALATCDGANLKQCLTAYGVAEERIINLPLGVDRNWIRKKLRPLKEIRDLISTRSLEPIYDVETTVRALSLAAVEAPLRLTVVGEGSLKTELRQLAKEIGAEGHVRFTGRLDQARLMEELDRNQVYISASLSDSTSVSLLEAMARGLVPVVSDIPGNREWIEDRVNGFLFAPKDYRGLARILVGLARGETSTEAMVQRNIELVSRRGCWQANMESIEKAFIELCRRSE